MHNQCPSWRLGTFFSSPPLCNLHFLISPPWLCLASKVFHWLCFSTSFPLFTADKIILWKSHPGMTFRKRKFWKENHIVRVTESDGCERIRLWTYFPDYTNSVGGGGFPLAYRGLRGKVRRIIPRLRSPPPPPPKWRQLACTNSSASWENCGWMFPDELRVSSFFLMGSPLFLDSIVSLHSVFVGSRVYACLSVKAPPALLANWPGSLHATVVTGRWEDTAVSKSRHRKFTLEKKILPSLLPKDKPATFPSRLRHCTTEL